MQIELCPCCGGDMFHVDGNSLPSGHTYFVVCWECEYSGRVCNTEAGAIAAHNALSIKVRRSVQLEQENEDLKSALSGALACGVDHGCRDCAETYKHYFPDDKDIDLSVVGEKFDLRISEYREFAKLAVPIVEWVRDHIDTNYVKAGDCTACLAAYPEKENKDIDFGEDYSVDAEPFDMDEAKKARAKRLKLSSQPALTKRDIRIGQEVADKYISHCCGAPAMVGRASMYGVANTQICSKCHEPFLTVEEKAKEISDDQ